MAVWILVAVAVVVAVFLLGPRVPVDTAIRFDPASIDDDPAAYLSRSEALVEGIRDDTAKQIVFADPQTRARTAIAIVYVHGFSATSGELRPVPDMVAAQLGANIFYTRLTGHGLDGESLAAASVGDWINDYAEAIAIGRRLGDRVVVMAASTGAALASWAASHDRLTEDLAGMVLVSPNYGIQASGAFFLTQPWAARIVGLAAGPEVGFRPLSERHAAYWTTRYPSRAILPMAATARLARLAPAEDASLPALFIYSERDAVVRPDLTRAIAARWGGGATTILVDDSGDPGHHVIAGDALSPATNERLAGDIAAWVTSLER